jgi:WD40 repeat protein
MYSLKLIIKTFLLIIAINLNLVLTVNQSTFGNSLIQLRRGSLVSGTLGGWSNGIKIWNTYTRTLIKHITNVKSSILLCLSDGSLASADYEMIIILDIKTGEIKKKFKGHTDLITSLVQLPDDSLTSGSYDKTIRRWDINDKGIKIKEFNRLNGHIGGISSLVRLLDGSLASGSLDKTIKIWDIKSGEIIKILTGHTSPVLSLVVLNDGSLASGSDDKTIRIWNIKQETTIKILEVYWSVRSLVVLNDGSLASGGYDIIVWNIKKEKMIGVFIGHASPVRSLVVLNDGSLASGSYGETIRIRGRGKDFVEDYSNLFKIFIIFCIVIAIVLITIFLISIFIFTYYKFFSHYLSISHYLFKIEVLCKRKKSKLEPATFSEHRKPLLSLIPLTLKYNLFKPI